MGKEEYVDQADRNDIIEKMLDKVEEKERGEL